MTDFKYCPKCGAQVYPYMVCQCEGKLMDKIKAGVPRQPKLSDEQVLAELTEEERHLWEYELFGRSIHEEVHNALRTIASLRIE